MTDYIFGERPDFSKAKAGDAVWSILFGPGKIHDLFGPIGDAPILVHFSKARCCRYFGDGRRYQGDPWPDLFHSQPALLIPPKAVEREEIVKAWKIVFKNGDVVLTENEETAESWCRDGQEIIDLHGTRIVRKPQEWEVIPAWVSRKSFRIEPSDTDDIYIIGFRPKVEK
jgi:hypothetical protein